MTRRSAYLLAAVVTIVIGLLVHMQGGMLPAAARDVLGDALWATMMLWWLGTLWPHRTPRWRGVVAYVICVGVECSQLLHTPVLDALRATLPGRLVLGSGFDLRDLLAYAVGVLAAVLLETFLTRPLPISGGRA